MIEGARESESGALWVAVNERDELGSDLVPDYMTSGKPAGQPLDVLTGFVDDQGGAKGRPVGVAVDPRGALLVADDVGDAVWRVTGSTASRGAR